MKKRKLCNYAVLPLVALAFICSAKAYAQNKEGLTLSGQPTGQPPYPIVSYKELPNPVSSDKKQWKQVGKMNIGWGSTDIRYKKEEPVGTDSLTGNLTLTAWKGERVAAQLVISTKEVLSRLSYTVSDFSLRGGSAKIKSKDLLCGFVRYVMTDELNKDRQGGCGYRPDASKFDSTLVADPIDHLTRELSLPACTSQGIWVRAWIPQNAQAGMYTGTVTVKDGAKKLKTLKLQIKVQNHTLPEPSRWAFHLDLWQNPYSIARYHQVPLWSKEHFDIMKPYMEMYRDAGGKVITTSIMHKPWNGQTYDYYDSMVTWTRKLDGTWNFDFAVFDKWVEFMTSLGIDHEISCYSMVPWKMSFQYFDQATNEMQILKTQPGEKEYDEVWGSFLQSFAKHLKEKGWFSKTCISMDERPMETMQKVIALIRRADKEFKISLAGSLHEELSDGLYDYCAALRMKYSDEMLQKRKSEGKITTFYTSCEEAHPNTFTFSAPAEAEWMGWYAAKAKLDGYLRWCFCHWGPEPLLDSRFHTWAAGDTYLVYPGARTSIRFERLTAGIQAYEKIHILEKEFTAKHNQAALDEIRKALTPFDEMNLFKEPAGKMIQNANMIINKY